LLYKIFEIRGTGAIGALSELFKALIWLLVLICYLSVLSCILDILDAFNNQVKLVSFIFLIIKTTLDWE
jgi:hypothetical protein